MIRIKSATLLFQMREKLFDVKKYYLDLDSGERAFIEFEEVFRWGKCLVEITEDERKEILESDLMCVNDYDFEFHEEIDGCERSYQLEEMDFSFSEEEKQEIMESLRKL